jgi:hypothetical protein
MSAGTAGSPGGPISAIRRQDHQRRAWSGSSRKDNSTGRTTRPSAPREMSARAEDRRTSGSGSLRSGFRAGMTSRFPRSGPLDLPGPRPPRRRRPGGAGAPAGYPLVRRRLLLFREAGAGHRSPEIGLSPPARFAIIAPGDDRVPKCLKRRIASGRHALPLCVHGDGAIRPIPF